MNLGAPELLIVLGVILVLFGPSRLPSLARSLGEAQRELRAGARGDPSDGATEAGDHGPGPDASEQPR